MQDDRPSSENHWSGVEDTCDDPEETKVIFSALDSFSSVPPPGFLVSFLP